MNTPYNPQTPQANPVQKSFYELLDRKQYQEAYQLIMELPDEIEVSSIEMFELLGNVSDEQRLDLEKLCGIGS